ncbi:hypothetical protein M409DRAFT_54855 [Zasmidium cellare ATCC 36951]|uniref:Heterokaryon incompatibility domain-containing protein n=1 Tax=Zasmidium cellare ATCC 36951 TaxID=1080233 RepID=A0A6A6CH82_ZASCE|nr:uncharacterized protein M409DRAFT_54855 [Zasmidium cellare ATCC 36951]KAF2166515.1 hypothetical protein M409DRAFT_54855 [Zasmidium cellare ATCC 36951]
MANMIGPTTWNDESSKAIEQYMAETIHLVVWAVNNRYLGSDSGNTKTNSHTVWDRFTDDFNAEPEFLSAAVARDLTQPLPLSLGDDGFKTYVIGRDRVQEMFRHLVDAYPDYRMKANDLSTTVHEKARWAISYVSMETFDLPPGVIRHSLGVFEWKKIGGKWLMSKYEGHWVYAECPIDDGVAIRLLEVHQGPRDARAATPRPPVQADLKLFRLTEAPPYIALSYSWGELPADTGVYVGPLATLLVSKHLENALRQLRDPTRSVLVWVDALCINQADLEERNKQVSMMKQIFSTAESVYIWLGMAPGKPAARELEDGPDSGDLRWMVSLDRATRENEQFVGLSTIDLDYLLSWKEHAWWKRKWVLQEIAVARYPPLVLFDDYVFDGWAFFRAWPMELVFSRQWDVQADDIDFHVVGTQKVWKAFMSAEHSMRVPWKLRSWWEYYQVPLDGGRPLGELLRLAAASLASHDLDHVFGLIGLAMPFHRAAIPIDYKRTPKELFTDMSRLLWTKETNPTQHAILKDSEDSSFDVLAFQWERYESPSWVCDFARPTTVDRIDYQMWLYLNDGQAAERCSDFQEEPGSPVTTRAGGRAVPTAIEYARKRWNYHNVHVPHDLAPGSTHDTDHGSMTLSLDGFSIGVIRNVINAADCDQVSNAWEATAEVLHCDEKTLRAIRLGFSRYAEIEMSPAQFASFIFFATTNGHVGICHSMTVNDGRENHFAPQRGDRVVLVLGANTPFVIRCMISNDSCGCRNGNVHTITELERFIIC